MKLTESICKTLDILPTDILKKKYRDVREYTYGEVITRIISSKSVGVTGIFSELKSSTVYHMLSNSKFRKPAGNTSWRAYLLGLISYKYCSPCSSIKPVQEFGVNKSKPDGLCTECKSCCSVHDKLYYTENKDRVDTRNTEYRLSHLAEASIRSKRYKTKRALSTPSWANVSAMNDFYSNCPEGYQVDHIIPLQGELVSGLHVETNLQYLTKADNIAKGNTFQII